MQQLPTAMYSASAVDNEMEFCFLLIQDSEDLMYFFFLFLLFQIHHILYIGLVAVLTYIVLIFGLCILMYVPSPIFSNLDSTNSSSSSTSSTIPSVGLIVAVKAFKIPSSSLSESSSGSVSLNVAASALLFPMVLRYVGYSYFM